jgi:hypothetical protein
MLFDQSSDVVIGAQWAREDEPDITLFHDVRGDVSRARLQSAVGGVYEPETIRVEEGRLFGVPHVELEMVEALDRTEIVHIRRIQNENGHFKCISKSK